MKKLDMWIYNGNMVVKEYTRKGNIREDKNLNLCGRVREDFPETIIPEQGGFWKTNRSLSRVLGRKTQKLKSDWSIHRTDGEKAPGQYWLNGIFK